MVFEGAFGFDLNILSDEENMESSIRKARVEL